jgi:alpha-amylase
LSDLLAIGVRGFRLDAAKHMAPADIAGILKLVKPREGEKPYYFLEVIDYGGEAIHATDYLDVVGDTAELDVTEFKYKGVGDAFLGNTAGGVAALKLLDAASWSLLPSDRAVSFITNHDTERADAIYYQDGAANDLGNVFMLAWPYGYPSVMSSFAFNRLTGVGRDHGPPSMGAVTTPVFAPGSTAPSCALPPYAATTTGWVCEHRNRSVANMVAFRKAAAGAPVQNEWDNGKNQLAFSRGDRAFVALNHEATPLAQTLTTGLAAGRYCDVLSGDFTPAQGATPASCSGNTVEVDAAGKAALAIPAETALAIYADAKL